MCRTPEFKSFRLNLFQKVHGVEGQRPRRDRSRGTPYEVRSARGELQKSVLWTDFARGEALKERASPYDTAVRQHGGTFVLTPTVLLHN